MAIKKEMSTEEKIKSAARKVFTQKGFAGTRTRDIAQEAGTNLALVSYYFRSKENLFSIIMREKVQKLFGVVIPVLISTDTTLEEKLSIVVRNYTDMLVKNPDLPLFVLGEIKNHPAAFMEMTDIEKVLKKSAFNQQVIQLNPTADPLNILISMIGMILMPFIGMPVFKQIIKNKKESSVKKVIEERARLIPVWVMAIIQS